MSENKTNDQERMEKVVKHVIEVTKGENGSGVIKLMKPEYISCNSERLEVEIMFHVEKWELNPQGSMHGGLVCAAFDNTFGMLTHYLADNNFITTVDISSRFLKPIPEGSNLLIRAKACSAGKTLVSLTGEAYLLGKGFLAATSSSTFMILRGKQTQINTVYKDN